jgi:hypothetical protein
MVVLMPTMSGATQLNLDCFDILDKGHALDFKRKYKTKSTLQSTDSSNWIPDIVINNLYKTKYAEFSFTEDRDKVEADRVRIQMNLYELPLTTDIALVNFKFFIDKDLKPFLKSKREFKWLTIFEIWNDPGWKNKEHPFRITVNLTKRANKNFLRPIISGEFKESKSNKWIVEWSNKLDIEIYPDQFYFFASAIKLEEKNSLAVTLSGGKDHKVSELHKVDSLTHKDNTSDSNIWGINPIKLYTSPNVLDRISASGSSLKIKFYDPQVCLPH